MRGSKFPQTAILLHGDPIGSVTRATESKGMAAPELKCLKMLSSLRGVLTSFATEVINEVEMSAFLLDRVGSGNSATL